MTAVSAPALAATWYVNDNSTAGDSFTTAVGADTQPGTVAAPFKTIGKAIRDSAFPGDTIYIDAGTYAETVVIDTEQLALIGADSRVTIIDPPGAKTTSGLVGIKIRNCTEVLIQDIGIIDAFDGIWVTDADSCRITSDSFSGMGNFAVHVKSNFTKITNSMMFNANNGGYTIQLDSGLNTVSANTIDSGAYGMLVTAESNVITLNTIRNHLNIGIYLNVAGAYGNKIESNTLTGNGTWGLYLAGPGNYAYSNIIKNNVSGGIYASAGSNFMRFNLIQSCTAAGMELANNTVIAEQNDITGNDTGVFINTSSAGIILRKNNIYSNNVNNVRNAYSAVQTADRNWFGSADSVTIVAKLNDATSDFDPWRLGKVDTAAGADTVAPKAPDSVAIIGIPSDTTIILEWSQVTANEDGLGGAPGVSGYRIYRSITKDSSSWTKVGQVSGASALRFQDTSVAIGQLYFYRVTSFDTATPGNESFFSDSQPSDSAVLGASVNIYVNDTSTTGDSFTSAAGSDATGHGTKAEPFRTIATAMKWATPGDTIWIDAGLYAETVVIELDSISLMGKDSAVTVIDPPAGDGIFADTQTGLAVRDLAVTGAVIGIKFSSVSLAAVTGDSVGGNTGSGIQFSLNSDQNTVKNNNVFNNVTGIEVLGANVGNGVLSCDTNTIENNVVRWNTNYGISVIYDARNNTVRDNTSSNNTWDGVLLHSNSMYNVVHKNILESNRNGVNFLLANVHDNVVSANMIRSNLQSGVRFGGAGPDTNVVMGNDISGNDTGVWVIDASFNNVITKNNITGNTTNNVWNQSGIAQTFTRNWFGSADSVTIKNKLSDTASDFDPWRLGQADTALGADTTAPKSPDSVAIIGAPSDTSIILEWSAVSALEESNGGAVTLSAYRVYRSESKDSSSWVKVGDVTQPLIRFQDTDIALGRVYYYRVTARDATSPYTNESFYSDSQPFDSAVAGPRTDWYVNDTSTTGDSWTTATGSDVTGDGTKQKPFKSIPLAMRFVTAGDTIWIDAGLYDSYMIVNSVETAGVDINQDSIALIGVDSNVTVINPPGGNTVSGLHGIYADTQVKLCVKNIGVTGARNGIYFYNVDHSILEGDSASVCGDVGIYLKAGSDTNTIKACATNSNSLHGIRIDSGQGVEVTGNQVNTNTSFALYLTEAKSDTISNNTVVGNSNYGIYLITGVKNSITGNTTNSNASSGINMFYSCDSNTVSNNTSSSNTNYGIALNTGNSNTFSGNTCNSNTGASGAGIVIDGPSNNNSVLNNVTAGNPYGGIWLEPAATSTLIRGNASSADIIGIRVNGAETNIITQNQISGADSGIVFYGAARANVASKNNLTGNNVSHIYNAGGRTQTITRNWFGSADSVTIKNKISDTANTWSPWRLATVDTLAGADTTAPKAPDSVAVIGAPSDSSIILEWSAVTANEEGAAGGPGVSGYKVYRSAVKDTSSWIKVAQVGSGVIRWQDTDLLVGQLFYYRVTAFDTSTPYANESFFSDSQPFDSPVAGPRTKWYVNDATTAGDSYTSLAGSDATGEGTPTKPFLTIAKAFQFAGDGDTVFVDSGVYNIAAAVTIGVSNLSLIGVDSASTILDRGDTATSTVYGIYATNLTGLRIANLRVRKSWHGIYWNNVDYSVIDGVTVSDLGNVGFYNFTACDYDTFLNNVAYKTGSSGFYFYTSTNNYVKNNTALQTSSGFYMVYSADRNIFLNNRAEKTSGSYGFWSNQSDTNHFYDNVSFDNLSHGFLLDGAQFCVFSHNVVDSNADYQIALIDNGALLPRSNIVEKNSVFTSPKFPDSGVLNNSTAGAAQAFKRNWWGKSDSDAIKAKIWGSNRQNVAFAPWRLADIDSAIGADTTAPKAPDSVAVIGAPSDTSIIIEWSAVTANEEGAAGGPGVSGYKIYRSAVKDTSSWVLIKQLASGIIRYQDTTAALAQTYFYRVTAFDTATPYPNESFFSDSQPSDSAQLGATVDIYVNDGSTAGDSFTTAAGSDITGLGTKQQPFASLPMSMRYATAGDTIWIDAGLYDSYVTVNSTETAGVNIDKDSITLIGKDSNATVIDPPGDSKPPSLYGIYADTQTGLLVKNIGVMGAYSGIHFENVDISTIKSDSLSCIGNYGIHLLGGSSSNTISENEIGYTDNVCMLFSNSNNNTVDNNNVYSSVGTGIYLNGSSNNTVSRNTAKSTGEHGFLLVTSSNTNTYFRNIARSNVASGIKIQSSNTNLFYQNEITGSDTGVQFTGTASGNTVTKNNITACNVNLIDNPSGVAQTITRNWYGSADTVTIKAKINDSMDAFVPYRLGAVDTAAGADTVAPKAPDTVAVIGSPSDTSIILEWSDTTANEEGVAGGGISVYRVYRSTVKDTSSWIKVAQVSSTIHRWQDTGAAVGQIYYYRITSVDSAAPFENESFFSDSQPGDSAVFTTTVDWYVNDTATSGDSYTSAAGSDGSSGKGTPAAPFASIIRAMRFATAGDTIFVDAGLYDSYVNLSATETAGVNIDKDSITLVGRDSGATVIDPPGANTTSGLFAIYADTQTGLSIRDLGVTGAYDGMRLVFVTRSTATNDSASGNGNRGIQLVSGSDTNTISNNIARNNLQSGIALISSSGNTLTGNTAISNSGTSEGGIYLSGSSGNTISGNTANSNTSAAGAGINLTTGCNNNTISNNTASSNSNRGIQLQSSCSNNTISNNTTNSNNYGIELTGANNNTISGNSGSSNSNGLVYMNSCSSNTVTNNIGTSNGYGITVDQGASGNVIANNVFASNTNHGVYLWGVGNTFTQNRFYQNTKYQFYIAGTASSDTIVKNNIYTSATNPDSGVYNSSGAAHDFRRNFWNTADSATIKKKIFDTSTSNLIKVDPFRLGEVDTVGGDSVAPKAPDTVAAAGSDTSVIVSWKASSTNEEAAPGGVGVSGYRVYRSEIKDTSSWIKVAQTASTVDGWQDTNVVAGRVYYYRVTAFDTNTPFANESFYSDSQPSDSPPFTSTVNWYVNDMSTAGDSFSSAAGNDVTGNGTASSPFLTIIKAMRLATAGDTVYVDAGFYDSYTWATVSGPGMDTAGVRIDKDSITLVGKDSNATVINPPGDSTVSAAYGIIVTSRGNRIKNLGVTGTFYGIIFYTGGFQSSVEQCSSTYNGGHGLVASWGAETITITGGNFSSNLSSGVYINASYCTVTGVTANSNVINGIYAGSYGGHVISNNSATSNPTGINVEQSSRNTVSGNTVVSSTNGIYVGGNGAETNTISNNTLTSNATHGIMAANANASTFSGNTVTGSSKGLYFGAMSNASVTGNTSTSNTYGIEADNCSRTTFSRNVLSSNSLYGLNMIGPSKDNTFVQNTFDSNVNYQVYMAPNSGVPAADTFLKNNFNPSPTNPDSGVYVNSGNTFDFTRNYWGRTDSASIGRMMADTLGITNRIKYEPFRLGQVDTASGADTTAPAAPTGIAVDTATPGQMTITWVIPTINEETNGGSVGFAGAKIYRLKNSPDTTHWANALVWTAGAADTTWVDTGATSADTFYYRLTSRDTAAFVNQSYFADAKFAQATPKSVKLDTPNGGEIWRTGDTQTISWSTVGSVPTVDIHYSTDTGATFPFVIAASASNTGSYAWNIPDTSNRYVRIRVKSSSDAAINDISDTNFSLAAGVQVTAPNGGENWTVGAAQNITWTNTGTISNVKLEYSTNGGSSYDSLIVASTANSNSYTWTIPDAIGSAVRVRVSDAAEPNAADASDANFSIRGALTLTRPNTSLLFTVATSETVTWTTTGTIANVKLDFSTDTGATFPTVISAGTANTGTFLWTVADSISTSVRVRVSDSADAAVSDASDANFKIKGALTLSAPNGGEAWPAGVSRTIAWTTTGTIANVRLEYSTDNGSNYTTIVASTGNSGSYGWTVPGTTGENNLVRVADASDTPAVNDASNAVFAIVTDTSGANVWYVNDTSTANDSYTTAVGNDANHGQTPAKPKRTIMGALPYASAGDTIYVDAGLYTEAVVIDTNNIALIGKDSNATVVNPPTSIGIFADTQTGLLIKNIGVTGATYGIQFQGVDLSTVTGDSVSSVSQYGLWLMDGSESNTVSSNQFEKNQYGVWVATNSTANTIDNNVLNSNNLSGVILNSVPGNTISNNTINSNSYAGVEFFNSGASNNRVKGNVLQSNSQYGVLLSSGTGNTIEHNSIRMNTRAGVYISSNTNVVISNDISGNDTGVLIESSASGNTIAKNNISGNNVKNLLNLTAIAQTQTRNWWGSTDESVISAKYNDTFNTFIPYRLGPVDTAPGADTTAPIKPTGVTLNTATAGRIAVEWTAPAIQEETNGGALGFQGVRVYRLRGSVDTTHWANAKVWTSGASDTTWYDTGAQDGATYYYRLTSRDAAAFVNESFFTDTVFATSVALTPETITLVSGNHQLCTPGSPAPAALRVRVVDANNNPLASETVTFDIAYPTGGTLSSSGAHLGDTSSAIATTAYTDASGFVTETITVGATGDVFRVKATVARNTAKNVTFTAYVDGRDIPDSSWRMLGPNKYLVTSNPSSLTSSDLGAGTLMYEHREDKGLNASLGSGGTKFHVPTALERGRGYWMKPGNTGQQRWRIDEGSQGVAGFDTVKITLHAQGNGWNQIASGQYFYVDWQKSVKVDTGLGISDSPTATQLMNMISIDSAHEALILSKIIYWYTGSAYEWGPNSVTSPSGTIVSGTSTVSGVQMKPVVGFWVKTTQACTLWVFPNPVDVPETSTAILQQAPVYGQGAPDNLWAIRLSASSGGKSDPMNYVGVAQDAKSATLSSVYEPPAAAGGYVAVAIRPQTTSSPLPASPSGGEENSWLAASYAEPIGGGALGRAWEVAVASDQSDPVALTWDNVSNLPSQYEAYLIGGPSGPVNMRKSSSVVFQSEIRNPKSEIQLTLAVGMPEYLAGFLAAPLDKDQSFVYPNPGPDATGIMTFKYNLPAAADVTLKIYDMGGKLVRELKGAGTAAGGATYTVQWDTTNKHGQRMGSGVYIYILESGGNKLVDKLAIVR